MFNILEVSENLEAEDFKLTEDGKLEMLTMQGGSLVSSMKMQSGATIFNESSNDIDFRVESSGN